MKYLIAAILTILMMMGVAHATVTSPTYSPVTYSCNGVTKVFPFTFPVDSTSDVVVTLTSSTGYTVTLTTGFTTSCTNGECSRGGRVTTTSAYGTGYTLTLSRSVPLTQGSEFTEGMPTLYSTFERGLDKLTMITQQIEAQITDPSPTTPVITDRVYYVRPEWYGTGSAAVTAAVAALPNYGTLLLGASVNITTPVVINKPINITGPGYFWCSVGTSEDCITFGNTSTYTPGVKWDFGGVFGASGAARNGVVINKTQNSIFNFPIKLGTHATGYAVRMADVQTSRLSFLIDGNTHYGFGEVMPTNGIGGVGASGNAIIFNANNLYATVNGLTGNSVYVCTSTSNGNSTYSGTFEGNTGDFILKGGSRANLRDIHSEAIGEVSGNRIIIQDHYYATIGPRVDSFGHADTLTDVSFLNTTYSKIIGLTASQLEFDASSSYNGIINAWISGNVHSKIVDAGRNNWGFSPLSSGAFDLTNLVSNGSAETWSSDDPSPNWTVVGGASTNQEVTIVKHGTYSVKVTSTLATDGLKSDTIPVALTGTGEVAISIWVYIPTAGGQDVAVLLNRDGGAATLAAIGVYDRDKWVHVSKVVDLASVTSGIYFQLMPSAGTATFYVDAASIIVSHIPMGALYY